MSGRIGIELSPGQLRAVRLDGWFRPRIRAVETSWTPDTLTEAVIALRDHFGPAARVAVAVDVAFLYAKYVKLPPVPAPEKRRMLTLEPERFFPVRAEDLVVSIRDHDNLVFAGRESLLAGWVTALSPLGALDRIEPAPMALARALTKVPSGQATVLLPGWGGRIGIVQIDRGVLGRVRRVGTTPADVVAAMSEDGLPPAVVYSTSVNGQIVGPLAGALGPTEVQVLPAPQGLTPIHLSAYGAALGIGKDLAGTLMPTESARRVTQRRRSELLVSVVAFVAALFLAIWSLDARRARVLEQAERTVADLRTRTAPVLALQGRAEALARTGRAVAAIEQRRVDPAQVLAALTERLPKDAYLQGVRGSGTEWQIDGFARDAAGLVPLLEGDPRLEQVRFLAATNRLRSGNATHESFSIAFRYVAAP